MLFMARPPQPRGLSPPTDTTACCSVPLELLPVHTPRAFIHPWHGMGKPRRACTDR